MNEILKDTNKAPYKKKIVRNKELHKSRILQVAKELIEKHGYSNLTLRQISSKAEISVGLIYKDFPKGKLDIIQEICRINIHSIYDPNMVLNLSPLDLPNIINHILIELIQSHRKNVEINTALEVAYLESPDVHTSIEEFLKTELNIVMLLLRKLNSMGIITVEEPKKYAYLIVNMIDALIHRQITFGIYNITDKDLTDFLKRIIVRELNLS